MVWPVLLMGVKELYSRSKFGGSFACGVIERCFGGLFLLSLMEFEACYGK